METSVTVFVLWDPRSPDVEWIAGGGELERQGIEAKIVTPVYNSESVEKSINLSHKNMVRMAKAQNLPEVCILESDAQFPAPDGWQYFLENKPATFDIYLGGAYGLSGLQPGARRIISWEGMHCYIIHSRFYDRFLSVPEDQHIDVAMDGLGVYYVCYPFAAIQRPGWSATSKQEVNYNRLLSKEDVYGW